MSKLVTIYGGSGFVGRYIARRMAKAGWRVRVAVRRPNEAMHVKPYGAVGQVEPILCNIRDEDSVRAAMVGADAVVNCVGILNEVGKNEFGSVQAEGATRIAQVASELGIETLVHLSSIGADENAPSEYARTKAAGEAGVLAHMPNAVILRPSIIFGVEDQFFNKFAAISRFGPVLPVVCPDTLFQPVYVDDVAKVAQGALLGAVAPGTYELGGPEVASFRTLMEKLLDVIHRRRLLPTIPTFMAGIMAWTLDIDEKLTFGLFENTILTRDQLKSLQRDNVVSDGAKGFADLGITPTAMEVVLPEYLWKFRPSGQYDEMTRSAQKHQV
jgi:NADH dehydrogenase